MPLADAGLAILKEGMKDYIENSSSRFNALIYGRMGSGKTSIFKTVRKPVYVISFDPGGVTTLQDDIDGKTMIVDTRFEREDPRKPWVWTEFDKVFHRLKTAGLFAKLGTLGIDSLTTLAQCALNWVMAKEGRAGGHPFQNDWLPQMALLENFIRELVSLPCDTILIAHPDMEKDDLSGKTFSTPMITGKLKTRLPILFSEIYYADTVETKDGINYRLITQKTGMYDARSRLGRGGRFDLYELPDVKHLLKKAGYSTDDFPPLNLEE